jgi:hypothetical protein
MRKSCCSRSHSDARHLRTFRKSSSSCIRLTVPVLGIFRFGRSAHTGSRAGEARPRAPGRQPWLCLKQMLPSKQTKSDHGTCACRAWQACEAEALASSASK